MELVIQDRPIDLGRDDVHIWPVHLELTNDRLLLLHSYLSSDERARADRYHFPRDRDRFICSRGLLRELLCIYGGQHPASIRFSYGEFGKPEVAQSSTPMPQFNYSRSADVALFAFSPERAIGIDIEHVEDDEEFLSIAVQHYTHAENMILDRLEKNARMTELFRYWTRREAYLKATGQGLTFLTGELDVADSVVHSPGEEHEWNLETFDAIDGYSSSIAVAGAAPVLKLFRDTVIPQPFVGFRTAS